MEEKNTVKNLIKNSYNALRVLVSVVLMLLITYNCYSYLDKVFVTEGAYTEHYFHNLPEDTMDVIVLGSSHTQYSFLSSYFYKDTDLTAYSLGTNCQPLKVSYQMLKEALKTQNPKLLIMEVYTATPTGHGCQVDGSYVMAAYEMTGEERLTTFNYLDEEKAATYRNEFINNHNNWRKINSIYDLVYKENKEYGATFGYLYNWEKYDVHNYWYANNYDYANDIELYPEDLESLNDIYDLCLQNDIQLMFYYIPMEDITQEDFDYRNAVWKWANERNIQYIDFVEIQRNIDYRMMIHTLSGHPYINGAALLTYHLSNFVNENYSFSPTQISDELRNKYEEDILYHTYFYLDREMNPLQYVRCLRKYPGKILIRYTGSKQYLENEFVEALHGLGVSDSFDYRKNYYALIDNGEIVDESEDCIFYTYEDSLYTSCKEYISINDKLIDGENEFTIVVLYDETSDLISVKNIEVSNISYDNGFTGVWEKNYDPIYKRKQ